MDKKDIEIIVIPDVHGRDFWQDAVRGKENKDIIFLGDYIDPYPDEGITKEMALDNFREILVFAIEHRENVTLLLGNHDLAYFFSDCQCGRHDYENQDRISDWFESNKDLFSLVAQRTIGDKSFLFTHAGVHPGWVKSNPILGNNMLELVHIYEDKSIVNVPRINSFWNDEPEGFYELMLTLNQAPHRRGGPYEYGSFIWSDVRDMLTDETVQGYYQVFGHTQLKDEPIIMDDFACLDNRRAYVITNEGEIIGL